MRCILDCSFNKQLLLQTVKTQMNLTLVMIMQHFINDFVTCTSSLRIRLSLDAKFLFHPVRGCNSIADLSLKIEWQ